MTTINALRHPQILFRGFEPGDPRLRRMRDLAGASYVLEGDTLEGLRPGDWDVVVVEGVALPAAVPESTHVIAFDSEAMGRLAGRTATMRFVGRQPSPTMHIDTQVSSSLRELLTTEAVPWLESQPARPFLQEVQAPRPSFGYDFPGRDLTEQSTADCLPMISDSDGHILVGAFPRRRGAWCWAIPYRSEHPEKWLALALASWRAQDAERFPHRDPWLTRDQWTTPAERAARAQLAELRARRAELVADLAEREAELEAAITAAAEDAQHGSRRLLTHAGKELVEATVDGFTSLGFELHAVDEGRVEDGVAVVEDLFLTTADEPGRPVILDVVGYPGPAGATDLLTVAQHASRHLQREGVLPHRSWLVVNSHLDLDPDERPDVAQSAAGMAGDIAAFAQRGGLVIDTRELFRLLNAVADGRLTPPQARALLEAQDGVFTAPRPAEEDED